MVSLCIFITETAKIMLQIKNTKKKKFDSFIPLNNDNIRTVSD